MNTFENGLREVLAALRSLSEFAVVGGLAMASRTRPRFTADVDLIVAVESDQRAEDLVRELQSRGYQPTVLAEQEARARLASVRMELPGSGDPSLVADLLFASSGIEAEVVDAAEEMELYPGLTAPVATVGHLLALKVLALAPDREHDERDIGWLLAEATETDLQQARDALALIEERGFNRGKRLLEDFDLLYERFQTAPWG